MTTPAADESVVVRCQLGPSGWLSDGGPRELRGDRRHGLVVGDRGVAAAAQPNLAFAGIVADRIGSA